MPYLSTLIRNVRNFCALLSPWFGGKLYEKGAGTYAHYSSLALGIALTENVQCPRVKEYIQLCIYQCTGDMLIAYGQFEFPRFKR